jgi:hypothetical protein
VTLAQATAVAATEPVVLVHVGRRDLVTVIPTELRDGILYLRRTVPDYPRLGLVAREARYERAIKPWVWD